jgi:crotonobetainyl-CoA:carnitine CoA-transferase CaiB-like acyl-CoA transferase
LRLNGERLAAKTAPPSLGNATWDILAGIGIGASELTELSRTGIINEQKRP